MAAETAKKIVVDQDLCIGCGACVDSGYFDMVADKSQPRAYNEADADKIQEAVDGCPVGAISIE